MYHTADSNVIYMYLKFLFINIGYSVSGFGLELGTLENETKKKGLMCILPCNLEQECKEDAKKL